MRRYAKPPSLLPSYLRALSSRKPRFIADGGSVPHLEAIVERIEIDAGHLAAYRRVCGAPETSTLPFAYPHVLAASAHLALLSCAEFPVRVLGILHIGSRIERLRPLAANAPVTVRVWIAGLRAGERGQELELHTELSEGGEAAWRQVSTLLLRRPMRRMRNPPAPETRTFDHTIPVDAPAEVGRHYARVSGDFNPIHLTAVSARLFGFPRAIAHGMWSLARCAALLQTDTAQGYIGMSVDFRSPVLLPASLVLEHTAGQPVSFVLRNRTGERTHLSGSLTR